MRTEIVVRPLGTPLPLGLAGLTIASLVFSGLDLGWVPTAQTHAAAIAVLAGAVPMQTAACLFAFPSRDGPTAAANALLAATWSAFCLVRLNSPPGSTSAALGLDLVAAATLLAGSAAIEGLGKPLVGLAVGLAGARFAVTGVYELSSSGGWQDASGALGLAVAAVAAYCVVAFELEDALDRPLLPTLRVGRGRQALAASGSEQVADAAHEPGVREQL